MSNDYLRESTIPDAPRSVKQIFLEALAIAPEERAAWLSNGSLVDLAVRTGEIENWLIAHTACREAEMKINNRTNAPN